MTDTLFDIHQPRPQYCGEPKPGPLGPPISRSALPDPKPLPTSADVAALASTGRRQRILQYIVNWGPTTIHDFCAEISDSTRTVHAHQVSGRFTDMAQEMLLKVITQKPHPVSGASCNVYDITDRGVAELQRMKTNTTRGQGDTGTRR